MVTGPYYKLKTEAAVFTKLVNDGRGGSMVVLVFSVTVARSILTFASLYWT